MLISTRRPYIFSISANIGAGKTTLLNLLKERGFTVIPEDVENWTYLKNFYDNQHIAILLQLQIMLSRFRQMKNILKLENIKNNVVFIERSTLDSLHVFALNALNNNNMSQIDYDLLKGFTEEFGIFPDQIIYLQCSPEVALERKHGRNRSAEKNMTREYIYQIHECYEKFIKERTNTIIINVDGISVDEIYNKLSNIIKNDF